MFIDALHSYLVIEWNCILQGWSEFKVSSFQFSTQLIPLSQDHPFQLYLFFPRKEEVPEIQLQACRWHWMDSAGCVFMSIYLYLHLRRMIEKEETMNLGQGICIWKRLGGGKGEGKCCFIWITIKKNFFPYNLGDNLQMSWLHHSPHWDTLPFHLVIVPSPVLSHCRNTFLLT